MKIFEIINEDLIDPQEREWRMSEPYNMRKIGNRAQRDLVRGKGGAYAAGTPDPKDPFIYRKKSRQPSKLPVDAYYQYLKFVQPFVDENPFFPRVYNIDIKTDAQGRQKPSYKLEKLMSLKDADNEMHGGLDEVLMDKYVANPDDYASMSIGEYVSRAADHFGDYYENIKDEKLKEAIDLINYFIEENPDFLPDLHQGNMMVRFGPGGPQLVFTDPVQDQGKSIVGYNVFKGDWTDQTDQNHPKLMPMSQASNKLLEKYINAFGNLVLNVGHQVKWKFKNELVANHQNARETGQVSPNDMKEVLAASNDFSDVVKQVIEVLPNMFRVYAEGIEDKLGKPLLLKDIPWVFKYMFENRKGQYRLGRGKEGFMRELLNRMAQLMTDQYQLNSWDTVMDHMV